MPESVASDNSVSAAPETFRKRLLRHGAGALTDGELLALLLGHDSCDQPSLELSTRILDDLGGLRGIGTRSECLRRMPGLAEAHCATLTAIHEIACRFARASVESCVLLDEPGLVARYVYVRHAASDQEVFGVLFLDIANRLIGEELIFRGTLSRIAVEPRPILRSALEHGAAGLLLFHTHTTTNSSPSACDLQFTGRVRKAADTLGIRLVDHVIVAQNGHWSSLHRRATVPVRDDGRHESEERAS
ncbi:MAG: DNA repair protein RadC [Acidobacteriota bacterium]